MAVDGLGVLKLERTSDDGERITIRLIGRAQAEHLGEIKSQIGSKFPTVTPNLEEVTIVDVDVVCFLGTCEKEGAELRHCPPYIRKEDSLLFLTGSCLLRTGSQHLLAGCVPNSTWRRGGRRPTLAARNALSVARRHLGSLDDVTRVIRVDVMVATAGDVRDQPKVANGASELLEGGWCAAWQAFRSARQSSWN